MRGPIRIPLLPATRKRVVGYLIAVAIGLCAASFYRDASLADPMALAFKRWGHGVGLLAGGCGSVRFWQPLA